MNNRKELTVVSDSTERFTILLYLVMITNLLPLDVWTGHVTTGVVVGAGGGRPGGRGGSVGAVVGQGIVVAIIEVVVMLEVVVMAGLRGTQCVHGLTGTAGEPVLKSYPGIQRTNPVFFEKSDAGEMKTYSSVIIVLFTVG